MANAVFQIDSQITSVERIMYVGAARLQEKQENVSRLKQALAHLLDCEEEFHYNRRICLDPSLSKTTWNGSMATDFDVFKQREIQGTYQSIEERDLQMVISRVETEIEKIKQEILSLENSQVSQQSRLNDLHDQRRRELLKS